MGVSTLEKTSGNSLIFTIQTMQMMDGKALRALTPDEDGWYKDIALGLIGVASRGRAFYEVDSVVNCMTNPNTAFYKKLTEGNLLGEYGHPFIKDKSEMMRVLQIEMTKVSHAIRKIYTKRSKDNGFIVVFGDVKPTGPYGKHLNDSFQDATRNTSFSLRSICSKPREVNGVQHKRMLSLVTFDAVDGPGYKEASKRYAGMESQVDLEESMSLQEAVKEDCVTDCLGLEHGSVDALFELLQTDAIKVNGMKPAVLDDRAHVLITSDGKESIFHTFFNK